MTDGPGPLSTHIHRSSSSRRLPTRQIGPYELLTQLGEGSSGRVFLARRSGIERMFALKLLPTDLDEEGIARVRREALVASRLDHPGIVRAVDVGQHQHQVYLVMDHVPGPTLQQRLAERPMQPEEAAHTLARIAEAVDAAHAAGVVHRDLKPANIIIDARDGMPKVTDFGLARDTRTRSHLTKPGEVLGTPYYMSPEQVRGEQVDARADVYALGVILYEMLTGVRPFEAKSVADLVRKILAGNPELPHTRNPNLPKALSAACMKALSLEPAQRYPTARALVTAISNPGRAETSAGAASFGPAHFVALGLGGAVIVALSVLAVYQTNRASDWHRRHVDLEEELRTLESASSAGEHELNRARARAADSEAARLKAEAELGRLQDDVRSLRQERSQLTQRLAQGGGAAAPRDLHRRDGHVAQVVDRFIEQVREVPQCAALVANLLRNRGRHEDGLRHVEWARREGFDSPSLCVAEFRMLARTPGTQGQQKACVQALLDGPPSPYRYFAELLTSPKQRDLATFRSAIAEQRALIPHENFLWNFEAMTCLRAQAFEPALEAARGSIRVDPTTADAYEFQFQALAMLWQQRGGQVHDGELEEFFNACRMMNELHPQLYAAHRKDIENIVRAIQKQRR